MIVLSDWYIILVFVWDYDTLSKSIKLKNNPQIWTLLKMRLSKKTQFFVTNNLRPTSMNLSKSSDENWYSFMTDSAESYEICKKIKI